MRIRNATGKVIYENAVPQIFEKHIDAILKMNLRDSFDRNEQPRGTISTREN